MTHMSDGSNRPAITDRKPGGQERGGRGGAAYGLGRQAARGQQLRDTACILASNQGGIRHTTGASITPPLPGASPATFEGLSIPDAPNPRANRTPMNRSAAVLSAASFCASGSDAGGVPASGVRSTWLASDSSSLTTAEEARAGAVSRRAASVSSEMVTTVAASRPAPKRAVGVSGRAAASGARPPGRPNTPVGGKGRDACLQLAPQTCGQALLP